MTSVTVFHHEYIKDKKLLNMFIVIPVSITESYLYDIKNAKTYF